MVRTATAGLIGALALGVCSGCYEVREVTGGNTNCEAVIESLAEEFYRLPQGCTAALEFDANYSLQRWALICASEGDMIDETQARRLTECCSESGTAVNRPDPSDAFVFLDADADGSGTIAVVSRHNSNRVYEATLSSGSPQVRFPQGSDWRDTNELATSCQAAEILDVTSYDEDGDANPVAVVELLRVTGLTGVPDAIRSGDGELLWTMVVRAGAGPAENGGWVVLLQSSSLGIDFT